MSPSHPPGEACSRSAATTLIRLSQRQDPHAFSALVDLLRPRLERLVRTLVRSAGIDADDVLQESLVHAFRSIPKLRVSTADGFVAWFSGIVRNRIATAWRKTTEAELGRSAGPPTRSPSDFGPGAGVVAAEGTPSGPSWRTDCVREGLPELTCHRRLAYLLRDGFRSSLDTLGLVLDRGSHHGMRRSLREARSELADGPPP